MSLYRLKRGKYGEVNSTHLQIKRFISNLSDKVALGTGLTLQSSDMLVALNNLDNIELSELSENTVECIASAIKG